MKLDYYERHLLALAVEACGDVRAVRLEHGWAAIAEAVSYPRTTLADALTALLTDLGVQVPERPSEEAVHRDLRRVAAGSASTLDPLLAAAVLEAGS